MYFRTFTLLIYVLPVEAERQSARMSKITNDRLTRSGLQLCIRMATVGVKGLNSRVCCNVYVKTLFTEYVASYLHTSHSRRTQQWLSRSVAGVVDMYGSLVGRCGRVGRRVVSSDRLIVDRRHTDLVRVRVFEERRDALCVLAVWSPHRRGKDDEHVDVPALAHCHFRVYSIRYTCQLIHPSYIIRLSVHWISTKRREKCTETDDINGTSYFFFFSCLFISSLQPYTPVRPGRVQLEYVSSWTSSTSGIYGRFWALRGRTTWRTWRC